MSNSSKLTSTLLKLIAEHTDRSIDEMHQHASLFDLGVTKDDLPQLCARVKAETGVDLTVEDVLATQDVHELAAMLKQPPKQPISGGGGVTKALKCIAMALLLPASVAEVSIAGEWEDGWGTKYTISSAVIASVYDGGQPTTISITHIDEEAGFIVGLNGGPGSYYPGNWSRLDWVEDEAGGLHICSSHYNAADEAAAMAAPTTLDHLLYNTTGCNTGFGFAFSAMTAPPSSPLAIYGEWTDEWDTAITISSSMYVSIYPGSAPSMVKISHYDNDEGFFVGQNSGEGNNYPGMWSRVDWVKDTDDNVHLCTTHFNQGDEAAAMEANAEHDHALYATTGCGGYAFSPLESVEDPLGIAGEWGDEWGSVITISSSVYVSAGSEPSAIVISQYSAADQYFVGQNAGPGSYYPGNWSRGDWVVDDDGGLHYCSAHYNAADEAAALVAPATLDHSLYDTTGCNTGFGFGFSVLFTLINPSTLGCEGHWQDEWGTSHTLSSSMHVSIYPGDAPSNVRITYFDNAQGFLVGENSGEGNSYPGMWSRVDWVKDTDDNLYLCFTHFDQGDEAAAMEANAEHDHAEYATTGCGGYAFSLLHPADAVICAEGCVHERRNRRSLLFGAYPEEETVVCEDGCLDF